MCVGVCVCVCVRACAFLLLILFYVDQGGIDQYVRLQTQRVSHCKCRNDGSI